MKIFCLVRRQRNPFRQLYQFQSKGSTQRILYEVIFWWLFSNNKKERKFST